jgi:spermidine/putrescine ABC transporter ATP-binding subunit
MEQNTHEIEIVDLRKVYSNMVAVVNSNIQINHGEFFSLLGPSGCGKTTTLKMIAGLEEPTSGWIYLAGEDVTYKPPYLRNVNTVFQDYALFPHMNVAENIYFPLKMKKIDRNVAEPLIKEMLELVNMTGYEKRLPQQLSGGQRQRIALARSLVNRPRALLLDEPLGALDFKLRIAMQKVLKDIQQNMNITFIYVTHDQTEAITMSDRICVMKDGLIHQIGTPDEIYNSPASTFVASFIGDMNFVEGRVENAVNSHIVVDIGHRKIISSRLVGKSEKGIKVTICVRPEKIYIHKIDAGGEFDNNCSGRIKRIVFRGNDYEITLLDQNVEFRFILSSGDYDCQKVGDIVNFSFKKDDVIVYQQEIQGGYDEADSF